MLGKVPQRECGRETKERRSRRFIQRIGGGCWVSRRVDLVEGTWRRERECARARARARSFIDDQEVTEGSPFRSHRFGPGTPVLVPGF